MEDTADSVLDVLLQRVIRASLPGCRDCLLPHDVRDRGRFEELERELDSR